MLPADEVHELSDAFLKSSGPSDSFVTPPSHRHSVSAVTREWGHSLLCYRKMGRGILQGMMPSPGFERSWGKLSHKQSSISKSIHFKFLFPSRIRLGKKLTTPNPLPKWSQIPPSSVMIRRKE